MKITFVITVSPVVELECLDLLVHSLNLQTSRAFDVVFYNQTLMGGEDILQRLSVSPAFPFVFRTEKDPVFFGQYPLWDIYGFHRMLLEEGALADFHMSLHMEEFLEPGYVEAALRVLEESGLDLLMGNLHATAKRYGEVADLASTTSAGHLEEGIRAHGLDRSPKWGLPGKPFFLTRRPFRHLGRSLLLGFRRQLGKSSRGYTILGGYLLEDVFLMRTTFAEEYDWYGSDVPLYFTDIHVHRSLSRELRAVTTFPAYLNSSRIYHLEHGKYYYQAEDGEFTRGLAEMETDNPVLLALRKSIREREEGTFPASGVLLDYRRKAALINYRFHRRNLRRKA